MRYKLGFDSDCLRIYADQNSRRVMSYKNISNKSIPTNIVICSRYREMNYTFWIAGPYVRGTLCNAFLWAHAIDDTAVIADVLPAFTHASPVEILDSLSILSALGYSHGPAEQK